MKQKEICQGEGSMTLDWPHYSKNMAITESGSLFIYFYFLRKNTDLIETIRI